MAVASLVVRVSAQVAEFQKSFASATRTAQKFERDFANTASSVSAQQKRISDAFTSFSGDKLAREAIAVAKAVEQIGGASKLTAKEQAQVNAVTTEAIAKYQAIGQQAPKALVDLELATRKVGAATAELPKQLSLSEKAVGLLSSSFGQFTAANLASSAIQSVISKIGEFVAAGDKLPGIRGSFARLSAGIGESSAGILTAMQGATRGLVSNLDLMQSANKAMLLGLPITASSIGDLSKAATTLGRAMGLNATQALDDLITALGRSSPLILDNLGLTVKVGEANDQYAKKLGVAGDALTDAERKTAFYEAAMEAARRKTQELGNQTLTLSDRFDQAWVAIGNVVTDASATINTGIGRAISSSRELGQFLQEMVSLGVVQATLNASIREQIAQAGQASKAAGDAGAEAQRNYAKELERTVSLIPGLTSRGREQFDAALKLGVSAEDIGKAFGMSAQQVGIMRDRLDDAKRAAEESAAAVKKIRDQIFGTDVVGELRLWEAALKGQGAAAHVLADEKLRKDLGSAIDTVTLKFGSLGRAGLGGLTALGASLKALAQQAETIPPAITPTLSVFTEASISSRGWATENAKTTATLLDMVKTGKVFKDEISGKIFKQMREDAAKAAAQVRTLSDTFKDLGGVIVGAIQGGGNIGGSIGAFLGADIGGQVGAKLGKAIGGVFGETLGSLAGPLGALAGKFFGDLISGIGGPSKDELLGRDVVGQFEQTLQGTLSAAQKLSAGNESWKLTTIAVRDAYVAAGRSSAEAEAAVKKLWDSSKSGADASRLAVLEIQAVMDIAAEKQRALGTQTESNAKAIEDATAGVRTRISDLTSEYDQLFRSIQNEAPEEVMGDIEKMTRERMAAVAGERKNAENELEVITHQMENSFEHVADAAVRSADIIRQAFEDMLPGRQVRTVGGVPALAAGGIVRKPTLALIGEAGPEAVVPLGGSTRGGAASGGVGDVFLDSEKVGEIIDRRSDRKLRSRMKVGVG